MVSYLTDPTEQPGLPEGMDFSTKWKDSYKNNRAVLGQQLQLPLPCIRAMLAVWQNPKHR